MGKNRAGQARGQVRVGLNNLSDIAAKLIYIQSAARRAMGICAPRFVATGTCAYKSSRSKAMLMQ